MTFSHKVMEFVDCDFININANLYHYVLIKLNVLIVLLNRSFRTVLPASARDVYYRDEIGNISTSNLRIRDDSVEIDLRPRFPLFGGWKTHYKIGYNVPSYEYLYNGGINMDIILILYA